MPGDSGEHTAEELCALPKRKAVAQYDENLDLIELAVKVISYHLNSGKLCATQLVFQVSDNAGDSVSKISICNATPDLLKRLGTFLTQTGEELQKKV